MVLHDLLHHPAGAPRLPRHERLQEEVRLGVGRVLPNCSLPDHSPRLLRRTDTPELRPFLTQNYGPNKSGLTDLYLDFLFFLFFLTKNLKKSSVDFRRCSSMNVFMREKNDAHWCNGLFEELPFLIKNT